jgi:hypothetical protein
VTPLPDLAALFPEYRLGQTIALVVSMGHARSGEGVVYYFTEFQRAIEAEARLRRLGARVRPLLMRPLEELGGAGALPPHDRTLRVVHALAGVLAAAQGHR